MTLVIIGLLGGLITGISPCILPVLPVIFLTGGTQSARSRTSPAAPRQRPTLARVGAAAGGFGGQVGAAAAIASGNTGPRGADASAAGSPAGSSQALVSPWRPYLVIAGLVTSFSVVTLVGSLLLSLLHLPQDIIRWVAMGVLVVIGVGLIVPRFEFLLERPFAFLPRRKVDTRRNGFGVGLALGAVFVPCAGPVLAAIIVAGSTGKIGVGTVVLTLSFAVGVSVPLLFFALAGRRLAERVRAFRTRERGLRVTAGITMIALAVGLAFNVPQALQRLLPDYTAGIQQGLTDNKSAQQALSLGGLVTDENRNLDKCSSGATVLESCGMAPRLTGIDQWLNTPGGAPVSLASLRGRVVLVDFWAYSCINCQRSIPHVVAWDAAYRDLGLTVIGVHSPEYAFEKDAANVAAGARNFGITYPVALDNNLSTWTNYRNRYWPAHYLIDAQGTVRHIQFGEGDYANTEKLIRELLKAANPGVRLPGATDLVDGTPALGSTTRETFLGSSKDVNFAGPGSYTAGDGNFTVPGMQPDDSFALDGPWTVKTQYATPRGAAGSIRLAFHATHVRMVLGGSGEVRVRLDDGSSRVIAVNGVPRSYALVDAVAAGRHVLNVEVGVGVEAYSFTFG